MTAIDWDKSGVFSQSSRVSLGPSLDFVVIQGAVIDITSAGTFTLAFGIQAVNIKVNGSVTINLYSAKAPNAMALPNLSAIEDLTITDTGGFAAAHPITINPIAGETISGQTSVVIATNFGSVTLKRDGNGIWSAG
jgi:hypothetical protein